MAGQNVWQALGGMQVGSVWGHGSYVAPDWTADWLHREAVFILNAWAAKEFNSTFEDLDAERKGQLIARLSQQLRENSYDSLSGVVTISPLRAEAFAANLEHYRTVFIDGNADYAIPPNTVSNEDRLRKLAAFYFWSSWAAVTTRPGDIASYTNNWPHEPLVGNRPTGDNIVWTGVSIIVLLAGISAMAWWHASRKEEEEESDPQASDPLARWEATPSQRATIKYFWVVAALILVQMGLGVVTAHYGVEGDGFYGIPLAKYLPYSVARTWHVQIGLFWIATAWLAAGLFIGPLVSDREPKYQRLGVNVLFAALLLVVVGSLAGEWLSIKNHMTDTVSFYFGHQGYEYVDLGRFWQILLMVGLLLWLALMIRVLLHGHAALFGVYGMLGIGLMLMCLRVLIPAREWKDGLLRMGFWGLNIGLFAMCMLSLLPVGLLQTKASVEHGYWYARSSEFMQTDLMQTLRWMRVPGDTIFFFGALALVLFVAGLKTGSSFKKTA